MKERIIEFLRSENKSSAQLADEIGVQPSGISHIISGRNNPSLDFVIKMLTKYKYLSGDWLLFGKGDMYKDYQPNSLFDQPDSANNESDSVAPESLQHDIQIDTQDIKASNSGPGALTHQVAAGIKVVKIVWFYENNSFEEYYPRN